MGFLTGSPSKGSSESTSSSYNVNNSFLKDALGSTVSQTGGLTGMMSALLGGNGTAEQEGAFNKYKDSTGYNFMMDSGSRAITGNQASKGLLNSGSTLKALTKFGQGLGDTYFNNYIDQLGKTANIGLGAGNILAGSGQESKAASKSSEQGAKKGMLGSIIGAIL